MSGRLQFVKAKDVDLRNRKDPETAATRASVAKAFLQPDPTNPFALVGANPFEVGSNSSATSNEMEDRDISNSGNGSSSSFSPFGNFASYNATNSLSQPSELGVSAPTNFAASAQNLLSTFATAAQVNPFGVPSQTSFSNSSTSSALSFNFSSWTSNSTTSSSQFASQASSATSAGTLAASSSTTNTVPAAASTGSTFSFNFAGFTPSTSTGSTTFSSSFPAISTTTTAVASEGLSVLPSSFGFGANQTNENPIFFGSSSFETPETVESMEPTSDCKCEDCANPKVLRESLQPLEGRDEHPELRQQIFIPFTNSNSSNSNSQQPNYIAQMASVLIQLVSEYLNDTSALAWGGSSHFFLQELKRSYKLKQCAVPPIDRNLLGLPQTYWQDGINPSIFYRLVAPEQQPSKEDDSTKSGEVDEAQNNIEVDDDEDDGDDEYFIEGMSGVIEELEFLLSSPKPSQLRKEANAKMEVVQSDVCDQFAIARMQHLSISTFLFLLVCDRARESAEDVLTVEPEEETKLPTFVVSRKRMQHAFNHLRSLAVRFKSIPFYASRVIPDFENLTHAWDLFRFSSLTELYIDAKSFDAKFTRTKDFRLPAYLPHLKKLVMDFKLDTEAFFPSASSSDESSASAASTPFTFPPSLTELKICLVQQNHGLPPAHGQDWLRLPPALQRLHFIFLSEDFDGRRIAFPPLPSTLTYLDLIDMSACVDWKPLNTCPLPNLKILRVYRHHPDVAHMIWRTFCPNLERLLLISTAPTSVGTEFLTDRGKSDEADSIESFKRYQLLPESLQFLLCEADFPKEFHHLSLPDSIRILILGIGCKGPLNKIHWPLHLTHLHVSVERYEYPDFNGRSAEHIPVEWNGYDFPPSLESFGIGRLGQQDFANMTDAQIQSLLTTGPFTYIGSYGEQVWPQFLKFPPSLRHIYIGNPSQPLPFGCNESIEGLHINGERIWEKVYGLDLAEEDTNKTTDRAQNLFFPRLTSLGGDAPDRMHSANAARWQLPQTLQRIEFHAFNVPLQDSTTGRYLQLPASLTYINLGGVFNQDIRGFEWPPLLESLTLPNSFNQPIDGGFRIAHCLHMRSLTFGDDFSQCVRRLILPPNLESLTLGQSFHHPSIAHLTLPNKLRKLEFLFNRLPQGTTWTPAPLIFFRAIIRLSLPDSCTHVILPRNGIPANGPERKSLFESEDMKRWVTMDGTRKFCITY